MPFIDEVLINFPLPAELLSSAAEIYYEAFSEKMKFFVNSKHEGIQLAKEVLSTKQCIYAEINSECIGIAGVRINKHSQRKSIFNIYLRHAGIFRALSASIVMLVLDQRVKSEEMRIDCLAVHTNYRGNGIGKALLEKSYQIAKDNKLKTISIEVIESNSKARKLYEQQGFIPAKKYKYPIIGKYLGYSGSIIMEREVL